MAKPVGPICNLDCSYCYYVGKAASYPKRHPFRMSREVLRTYIRSYIESSPGPIVHFVWHGGEPTLAGLGYFRAAMEMQRECLPAGWQIWNNLQTNGTLLDDSWCEFLAAEHFEVGLSVDGTEALHDLNRRDRRDRGTYQRVVAAYRRLAAYGIRADLLCTVTPATVRDPVGVYRALRELGSPFLQFLPVVAKTPMGTPGEGSLSGVDYGRFLVAVFDEWVRHDLGTVLVQFFAEAIRAFAGGSPSLCVMAPTCGQVVALEHDGNVYCCDHFVDDQHRLGSIMESELATLISSPQQRAFGDAKRDALPSQCLRCPWLRACNGGCPKDRFGVSSDGEMGLNVLCEGLVAFFEYAAPYINRIVEFGRAKMGPREVMAQFEAEAKLRWHSVGRNDPCPCGSGRKAKACCWSQRP